MLKLGFRDCGGGTSASRGDLHQVVRIQGRWLSLGAFKGLCTSCLPQPPDAPASVSASVATAEELGGVLVCSVALRRN